MKLHTCIFRFFLAGCCLFFLNGTVKQTPAVTGRGFDVKHYLINLDILDFKGGTIRGYTDIQLTPVLDNLTEINLDLEGLTVDSVWVNEVPVKKFIYEKRKLIIPLLPPGKPWDPVLATVFYHGKPQRDPLWGGFYFADNEAFSIGIGFQSNPLSIGRYWYPCVDDFADKATHEYFIRVPKGMTAVCSGSLNGIYTFDEKTNIFHWEIQKEIPPYLSSVAVSRYECLSYNIDRGPVALPVSVYVRPADMEKARISFSTLPGMISAFENRFGPYRWERVGFVSVPIRGGAMEHAMNIAVPHSTVTGTLEYEELFAHELAHSWFGNLVTCETPSDMWFNEGWATWAVAVYIEQKKGWRAYKDYMRENHTIALKQTDHMAVYNTPPDETYGTTVYKKGADVVSTLRHYLGDEKFFRAIRELMGDFAYKNITTEQVKNYFQTSTRTHLDEFFSSWVYTPGFPHFAVDSFHTRKKGSTHEVTVYVGQDLRGRNKYSNENRMEILFLDQFWNRAYRSLTVSGPSVTATFTLPFSPRLAIIDPEERVADATIDEYRTLKRPVRYIFPECDFSMKVLSIQDSVFFRITSHWVTPDEGPQGNYLVNKKGIPDHYWTVEMNREKAWTAEAYFDIDRYIRYPDVKISDPLVLRSKGKFTLLYRKDASKPWEPVRAQMTVLKEALRLTTTQLYNGQYVVIYK